MSGATDGPAVFVEAVDRRDLQRYEAAWRDLAQRVGEPNVFAEPDFLIPALQRLANPRVSALLAWRDSTRGALIGLAAIVAPRTPFGLASLWRSEQAALPAVLLDRDAATAALAAIAGPCAAGGRVRSDCGCRSPRSAARSPPPPRRWPRATV